MNRCRAACLLTLLAMMPVPHRHGAVEMFGARLSSLSNVLELAGDRIVQLLLDLLREVGEFVLDILVF